jgi:SAM-dependent methyltransferase
VLNVGAGAGSYEPPDLEVTAVEPSAVMRAQRPPGAAPAVDARAEELPFEDNSFDASMAVLSDHHWEDHERGLAELRRVARRRVVLFTWEPRSLGDSWLVPIPHDCRDGFLHAYWRRPRAYLDPQVRAGISVFRLMDPDEVADAIERLAADLNSGEWERRNGALLELDELDLGYRIVVTEVVT